MDPSERVALEIASLRETNAKLFAQVNELKARVERDKEWEAINRSLVDQMGRLKAVASGINLDALAAQFALTAFPGEIDGASALVRLCLRQAELIVVELERRARAEGEAFSGARLKATEVLGIDHVHSSVCARVEEILRARGVNARVTLGGAGVDRAVLVIVHRRD